MKSEVTLFTKREEEIKNLLKKGMSNREIASILNISVITVQNHVSRILGKLNIHDRKKIMILENNNFKND